MGHSRINARFEQGTLGRLGPIADFPKIPGVRSGQHSARASG